jgi:hypothetical protein
MYEYFEIDDTFCIGIYMETENEYPENEDDMPKEKFVIDQFNFMEDLMKY